MKVSVDNDLCIGCGLCESTCSDVFEMQENIAVVKSAAVSDKNKESARQAAAECPVEAIEIEE